MTQLAMPGGASDAGSGDGDADGEDGEAEEERDDRRCLLIKISILISAGGSTAKRGLSPLGYGCWSKPVLLVRPPEDALT
jgi:hypothetical protein